MGRSAVSKFLSLLLSVTLVAAGFMPSVASAKTVDVTIEKHTQSDGRINVHDVCIDGVSAPKAGEPLDNAATVATSEGATWDIPVLWVSNDLQIVTTAEEYMSYLPVLAFYVPEGYALAGDARTVALSDSLVELFGNNKIISIYNAASGITYILPASVRDLFVAADNGSDGMQYEQGGWQFAANIDETIPEESVKTVKPSLVEIYCAQTARDALTDEDLEWLIDLIVNRLEPQAVELLLNSFPAFRTAAQNGEIGHEIGLYVYYRNGDKDGLLEHDAPSGVFAYLSMLPLTHGSDIRTGYLLCVNTEDMIVIDGQDNPVRDATTGKFKLIRDSSTLRILENTIVHELFHALMDDYNRTGMAGVTDVNDYRLDSNRDFATKEIEQRSLKVMFPNWFIEGSATTTENFFSFWHEHVNRLRWDEHKQVTDTFSTAGVVNNYRTIKTGNNYAYFDISNSWSTEEDGGFDNYGSAYVCGYLATLYLSELAWNKNTGSSAFIMDGSKIANVSTESLRMGLNSILERLHKGETLDQVIADISPADSSGAKLYKSTDDFESKFIKGTPTTLPDGSQKWEAEGDAASSTFVADYLNFFNNTSNQPGRTNKANGSILLPADTDLVSPLDSNKVASSDYLKIIESNRLVPSTVPESVAYASGGKSDPDATAQTTVETTTAATVANPAVPAAAESTAEKESVESADIGDGAANATVPQATEVVANTEGAATNTQAV